MNLSVNTMKSTSFLKSLLIFGLLSLGTQIQAGEIGLAVGEKAASFELKNQAGKSISLEALSAQHGNLALVFYRSAGWCPFCKRQLIALQENMETLKAAGITLVGISYDSVEVLERFAKESNIGFTLLSDEGSKIIDAYKVRNEGARPGRAQGIPHPTIFLVNQEGVITAKLREESYRDRPTIEAIVEAAKG